MRFLAAILLLANVGFFAWIYTQPEQQPPVYRPVPVPSGTAPLILLAERQGSPAYQSPPAEAASGELPEVQADSVPTETLHDKEVESVVVEEVAPPPAEQICQTIGPLKKAGDVAHIAQRLEAQGFATRQRSDRVREPSGYWVYLPAMPAADAHRIVSDLDSKGMKDYYIGKRNYISLGIFRRKDQAQVRFEQVTAFGYAPILDQRYRTRTVRWLDIEEAGQSLPGSSIWQEIQAQHTDIEMQRVSCE